MIVYKLRGLTTDKHNNWHGVLNKDKIKSEFLHHLFSGKTWL